MAETTDRGAGMPRPETQPGISSLDWTIGLVKGYTPQGCGTRVELGPHMKGLELFLVHSDTKELLL